MISSTLDYMSESNLLRKKAVIVVGNKSDLVRRREVTTRQATELAVKYRVKFTETSAGQGTISNSPSHLFPSCARNGAPGG